MTEKGYMVRCALCGTAKEADETVVSEWQSAKSGQGVYVCEACSKRVQRESGPPWK
jgi:uncharacterized protein YlaI